MKDILLLGHQGYLGSYLLNNLNVDILSTRNIYNNYKNYQYVINCIASTNIEYCEHNVEATNYSNRDVILDIKKYYPDSKIINFSSYYVYDDDNLCTEESRVTYEYNYSRQKLEAEQLNNLGITFRLGKLFGHPDLHKQYKLTEYILSNQNLVLDNISFNPTSLTQVLKVIKHELKYQNLNGIYNLSNKDISTHYEYGVFINNILNSNKIINKVDKIHKQFSNYGKFVMSCEKIEKKVTLSSWKDDMIEYLNSI